MSYQCMYPLEHTEAGHKERVHVTAERKWPYRDEEEAILRLRLDLKAAEDRADHEEASKIQRLLDQNLKALERLKKGRRGRL